MFMKSRLPIAIASALALNLAGVANAGSLQPEAVPAPMPAVPAPDPAVEKHEVLSSQSATVKGFVEPTGFKTLLRSGDQLPLLDGTTPHATATQRYGKLYQADGDALVDEGNGSCLDFDSPDATCADAISNSNDFNSLHQVGDQLYLVSHFETRPGAMYLTLLGQDSDGELTPQATRLIDFTGVYGGFVHCAGTVTPWNTHLGSEEYEPDARGWVDTGVGIGSYNAAMAAYYDASGWSFNDNDPSGNETLAQSVMNPYRYGYPVEVKVNADGSTDVTKHFAMGRSANELSIVMPDEKTVYITDDGTNTMLLMFVADTAGDLSAGTLYAGKWNQIADTAEGGRAWLSWINLGHATANQIEAAVDGDYDANEGRWEVQFDDLFDFAAPAADPDDGTCPDGFNSINSGHGSPYHECLAIKNGADETLVSRLETRRYAALKGATTEFRKMEGASFDPSRRTLYMAMSDVGSGMIDGDATRDLGGPNHIRLTANKCGAIYALRLSSRARDTEGNAIDSGYVARTMQGILAGERVASSGDNQCSLEGIGNPDNISFLPGYDVLIIGEDAGNEVHQIDMVWAYNLRDKSLTRIQTTPFGSETTSVYWYPDLNGWGYLMSVVQHPYGESNADELPNAPDGAAAKYGYVGYLKFPALN
jgi:secreted PhoX family phosphatase